MQEIAFLTSLWLASAVFTLPLIWWRFGRPYPLVRVLHVFWVWPLVWFVLLCDALDSARGKADV